MKLNISPSKFVSVLIVCAFILTQFIDAPWNDKDGVVRSDVKGYYAYLPALFINNDLKLEDISVYESENGPRIWAPTTPEGLRYIKFPVGTAVLYAPFFGAAHFYAGVAGHPQDGFSTPYLFALSMSALFYLVLALVFMRRILQHYFSETAVALTLLVVFFGTNAWNYYTFDACFSHGYSLAIITLFIYGAIKWITTTHYKYALWIGFSAGLMTLIRPIDIVYILLLPLLFVRSAQEFKERIQLLFKHKWQVLIMVLVAFICLVPQFLYFKYISGQWIFYSYSGENFFFNNPKVFAAMFSFRNGWLIYSPLMLFSLVGFIIIRKRNAGLFLPLLVVSVIYIYIITSWWCWWYLGFGNRAFINLYPLLSIPLAAFITFVLTKRWWWKLLFSCVVVLGLSLSIFQTLQYNRGVIHWGHMSKKAYYESFLKWDPTPLFETYLEVPNLGLAQQGENTIIKRLIDTVSVHKIDFEQIARFDSTHAALIQRRVVLQGDKALFFPGRLEYLLGETIEVKNANRIYIAVWVKNPEEFVLCISSEDKQFYAQSVAVVDKKQGWNKLELYSEIPKNVQHQKLLFYLWKIRRNDAYIDDVRIVLTHEEFVE